MDDEKLTDQDHAALLSLLQLTFDDINNGKHRQWTMTYYILLTYAAIIALYNMLKGQLCENQVEIYQVVFLIIALGLNVWGVYHIADIHKCVYGYRKRLVKIRERLSVAKDILKPDSERYRSYRYYFWTFTLALSVLLCVGLIMLVCFIMQDSPRKLIVIVIVLGIDIVSLVVFDIKFKKKALASFDA